jgi:hypothetical protein
MKERCVSRVPTWSQFDSEVKEIEDNSGPFPVSVCCERDMYDGLQSR